MNKLAKELVRIAKEISASKEFNMDVYDLWDLNDVWPIFDDYGWVIDGETEITSVKNGKHYPGFIWSLRPHKTTRYRFLEKEGRWGDEELSPKPFEELVKKMESVFGKQRVTSGGTYYHGGLPYEGNKNTIILTFPQKAPLEDPFKIDEEDDDEYDDED